MCIRDSIRSYYVKIEVTIIEQYCAIIYIIISLARQINIIVTITAKISEFYIENKTAFLIQWNNAVVFKLLAT